MPLPPRTRISLHLTALLLLALPALAGQHADYALAFEPGEKLWRVEARFDGRGEDALEFRFALWTPGAYHTADFGRFVRELEAVDERGTALAVERKAPGHFVVSGARQAKELVLRYRAEAISDSLFSHGIIDVESNRITRGYAYVNPVSLFGFVPARMAEPLRLALRLPEGWKAATVLECDGEGRFLAPSFLRFEDSPLLFSPTLESASFEVDGKPHRVTAHGRSAADVRVIADGCKRLVEAGSKLMRGLPYDRYHFLFGFADEAGGSGLEHSYSTLILVNSGMRVDTTSQQFWGITAHEFFHLWCAERIHVEAIHHPDLLQPISTGTIWLNEGITEYFGKHLLMHAGMLEPEDVLESYVGKGGYEPSSLEGVSWTDVSRATASWKDMRDIMAFVSRMYVLGPRTIFALDMSMRRATKGERGVLDLLHHLMANYAAKDRGFGEQELDDVLAAVAGKPAVEFYERYIDGTHLPEPTQYLDVIGYRFEDGSLEELENPTPAQLTARRDYFSVTGMP